MLGYLCAWFSRKPNPVPQELRSFHRREQMERMRRVIVSKKACR